MTNQELLQGQILKNNNNVPSKLMSIGIIWPNVVTFVPFFLGDSFTSFLIIPHHLPLNRYVPWEKLYSPQKYLNLIFKLKLKMFELCFSRLLFKLLKSSN